MTTAILLAAGHGTRLGRDKPTLDLDGETLVARHIRQAAAGGADDFVVVTNPGNERQVRALATRAAAGALLTVALQEGPDAHAAALTGLRLLPADTAEVFVAGITDIVPDDAYARTAAELPAGGIAIASAVLERTFIGGMLGFHPGTHRLQQIIERPPGGCPPGHLVNIWIHHLRGQALITEITRLTALHGDYESAVNLALAAGTPGAAVVLPWWEAVKDPASLDRARQLLAPATEHPAA
ncbi:NTP transferase domain-containing protein [Kitasatospora sp. NPDC089509]|uniref:NTP transferase domain-containing protein n=1 Tax=Kitasatospora sp. NPDC089509 TaxID=3364079 RepID=UPI003805F940